LESTARCHGDFDSDETGFMKQKTFAAAVVIGLIAVQITMLALIREKALIPLWAIQAITALLFARRLAKHPIEWVRIQPRFTIWGETGEDIVASAEDRDTAFEMAFHYAQAKGEAILIETATNARWLIHFGDAPPATA
jgi:hypothetical protein